MTLIANWRAVLRHAWSVKLILIAALLSGAEVALPLLGDWLPISQGGFALCAFLVSVGALLARFAVQRRLTPQIEPKWEDGERNHEDRR